MGATQLFTAPSIHCLAFPQRFWRLCLHEAHEGTGVRLMTFTSPFLYCLPLLQFSGKFAVLSGMSATPRL